MIDKAGWSGWWVGSLCQICLQFSSRMFKSMDQKYTERTDSDLCDAGHSEFGTNLSSWKKTSLHFPFNSKMVSLRIVYWIKCVCPLNVTFFFFSIGAGWEKIYDKTWLKAPWSFLTWSLCSSCMFSHISKSVRLDRLQGKGTLTPWWAGGQMKVMF